MMPHTISIELFGVVVAALLGVTAIAIILAGHKAEAETSETDALRQLEDCQKVLELSQKHQLESVDSITDLTHKVIAVGEERAAWEQKAAHWHEVARKNAETLERAERKAHREAEAFKKLDSDHTVLWADHRALTDRIREAREASEAKQAELRLTISQLEAIIESHEKPESVPDASGWASGETINDMDILSFAATKPKRKPRKQIKPVRAAKKKKKK